jgi:outer membrane lipoprotein-sorting protein
MTWAFALAALAAISAGDVPVAAPVPDASLDAFFADFAKKRDAVHSLEARFTQKNISPEEVVDSSGSIVYVKPQHIVFRYDKPDAGTTYLMHGHRVYEYEPDIKQLQVYDLEKNTKTAIFFLGFDDDTKALRDAYDVSLLEVNEKPVRSRGISLRPKNAQEGTFREVKLYLRDADYLPYRIHILNDDDSEVEITITDFAINGKLDPSKTQIRLPEATKIIENDQGAETVGPGGKTVPEEHTVVVEPLSEPKQGAGAGH